MSESNAKTSLSRPGDLSLGGRTVCDWDIYFETSYVDSYFYMAWFAPSWWQSFLLWLLPASYHAPIWQSLELTDEELDALTDEHQETIMLEHFEHSLGLVDWYDSSGCDIP